MNPGEAFGAAAEALREQAATRGTLSIDGETEVVCPACHGHLTFSADVAVDPCPFCLTSTAGGQVQDAPDRLAVDGVLPFTLDVAAADEAADRWIKKRKGAPKAFKKDRQQGSLVSVYASYFTFDLSVETNYRGERGTAQRSPTAGEGDTVSSTFMQWEEVSGNVFDTFEDVMVLANTGFDGDHVHELEPWPTDETVSFTPELLAGHVCRTPDMDVAEAFGVARDSMVKDIEKSVTSQIGGGDQKVGRLDDVVIRDLTYRLLLLPIWLLTVNFEGEPFQVFINGATGEVHGERPYTKLVGALRFWD